MRAKENPVYRAAIKLCPKSSGISPEVVICGYAKLLSLDEKQVRCFISEDSIEDLEAARKWFSDNKLDLNTIKSGLLLIVAVIPQSEQQEGCTKLLEFLEKEITGSSDILQKALELSVVPIKTEFSENRDIQDVLEYQSKLREKYSVKKSDEESETEEVDESVESKETSDEENSEKDKDEKVESSSKKSDDNYETKAEYKKETVEVLELEDLSEKYRNLSDALLDVVKGQDQAVAKFIQGYNQGELLKQEERKNRPKTYFFFFGPSGVGKTLLAETAAEKLNIPHKIFNMSEYSSSQSYEGLIGVKKVYNGAEEGALVKFVRQNPECLIIFDEIEKAHINVIRQFLQILGSGKIHNAYKGEDTSFQDATIIFTSNVGKELYEDRSVNLTMLPEKVLIDAIQKEKNDYGMPVLSPEICSRIASGNTIMFNHLSVRHLAEMVRMNFDQVIDGMEKKYGIKISYSKEMPLLFLYNRGGEIDARVATEQSTAFIKNVIFELTRQLENRKKTGAKIEEIVLEIEWDEKSAKLEYLFKNLGKPDEILIFSDNDKIFGSLEETSYKIHRAQTLDEAKEFLKNNISAVYIDPVMGSKKTDEKILSMADYGTDGVKLFHSLVDKPDLVPVFMLEMDKTFSTVDRETFLQEGAFGTTYVGTNEISDFKTQFKQIMEELYMERESQEFSRRGWVIDFKSKEELIEQEGKVKILFYDLEKKRAVDIESRNSILSEAERPDVSFDDVIGADTAKKELSYFVKYLQNPKAFVAKGVRPPKGVLLYGPPGTGKTMLARAMAGESDVTFLQASATDFKNKYVGESEANIRKIFAKAKKYAPSIIFIDEIDAIGKKRTGSDSTAHTESMLNALLTQMDGFNTDDSSKPVFVLAATNFGVGAEKDGISSLDDALIRRFDNKVYVDLPTESDRKKYILTVLKKNGISNISEELAQSIAERTPGQSLALLQNVINLALRNANKELRAMRDDDLLTALEDYIYGDKKEHGPEYYREVAIHETGHAYVSYISGDKPSYITIEARGNFGGYMQHSNQEDVGSYTREDLLARIRTSLAGRASEMVFLGKEKSLNTGASSDLQKATELAWRIVCTYGMDNDQLIVLSKDEVLKSPLASEYVSKVNEMLKAEMNNTVALIEEAKEKIDKIVQVLLKENRLTGAQFEKLMNGEDIV